MNGQFPRGGDFAVHVGRGDGPSSLLWVVFALLLVLLLIAAVSLALDVYNRSQRPRRRAMRMAAAGVPAGDPLAILGARYARGELSRDEYVQAREDLGGAPEATTEIQPAEPHAPES